MPRQARVVAVGVPHHVTQRGSRRQQIFFSGQDRRIYLELLAQYAERYHLRVRGYCLMTNHVHVIAVPDDESALARVFGRTHADYARYRNVVGRECGHFWQARYYSCPLGESHQWQALAYVERNPVRAGMVAAAWEWEWSSAAFHCESDSEPGLLETAEWERIYGPRRWRQILESSLGEEALAERLREATRRGVPYGGNALRLELEERTGRCLQVRPPGRPRRKGAGAVANE